MSQSARTFHCISLLWELYKCQNRGLSGRIRIIWHSGSFVYIAAAATTASAHGQTAWIVSSVQSLIFSEPRAMSLVK